MLSCKAGVCTTGASSPGGTPGRSVWTSWVVQSPGSLCLTGAVQRNTELYTWHQFGCRSCWTGRKARLTLDHLQGSTPDFLLRFTPSDHLPTKANEHDYIYMYIYIYVCGLCVCESECMCVGRNHIIYIHVGVKEEAGEELDQVGWKRGTNRGKWLTKRADAPRVESRRRKGKPRTA